MDLQTFVITFVQFVNGVVLPFILGIAFLVFLVNVIRFFVIGGGNQESQEKARSLALYSVLAFVFILVLGGIVNLTAGAFGLDTYANPSNRGPCPDYDPTCGLAPVCTGTGPC